MADVTTTQNIGLPAYAQPYAEGYLNRAQQVADSPYQAYTGQRVASFAPWQDQAYQAQAQRAMSGNPLMNAANAALPGMFQGGGQAAQNTYGPVQAQANAYGYVQPQANQYGPVQAAQNTYGPVQAQANQYGYVQPQSNAYAGSNPYLSQQIDAAQGDVVRNWNNVQKPQWDTAMQRSGSFGNSGIAQANQMAQSDMQRNLGNISSSMRFQDYATQQQLGEAAANRALQAGQFNAGLGESAANRALQAGQFNAGLGESQAGRNMQASQFNANLGESAAARALQAGQFNAGLGEAAAARALQAGQFNATMGENFAGRQDSMFNQGQGRALSALGMAPQYAQQDYNDINQLQAAGAAYQNQNQRLLDNAYQQFIESRAYPQQQLDTFGQALSRIQGNTSQTTSPGTSTGANLVGGLMTGAGLYNLLFGGK